MIKKIFNVSKSKSMNVFVFGLFILSSIFIINVMFNIKLVEPLYCLKEPITDNPYDNQITVMVMEESIVNDVVYIQYRYDSMQRIYGNSTRDWFKNYNKVPCSEVD